MATEEHTAAFRIFHYYYKCWLPQHHLYDRSFMETFGLPTSGNREVDRELANSETLCQLTMAEMAEHLSNGANLTLETPKDSVVIYRTLREHLMDWKGNAEDPIKRSEVPVDDLRKLDDLAGQVYQVARGYMEQDDNGSLLHRSLNALGSRRAMTRHSPTEPAAKPNQLPKDYQPVADSIARTTFNRNQNWRRG